MIQSSISLPQNFINEYAISQYQVLTRFKSKRNQVFKVEAIKGHGNRMFIVVKKYAVAKGFREVERFWLQTLKEKGVQVPGVKYFDGQCLIMDYIAGTTLLEQLLVYEKDAPNGLTELASRFSQWLVSFYQSALEVAAKPIILGDINLRNYIVGDEDKIYGVDFENCRAGRIETDLGRLAAFIATYNPSFTTTRLYFAQELVNRVHNRLRLDMADIRAAACWELCEIEKRRDITINDHLKAKLWEPPNPSP